MDGLTSLLLGIVLPIGLLIVLLVVAAVIVSRMYHKTTPEMALVKTGAGGRKVIQNGGTIVIGMIHEITPVNMETLLLEVRRISNDALITLDRMRVDVGASFYVRVRPDEEGISKAAQTLGDRTFDIVRLRKIVEDKLVDALRAVAAKMSMDDLHENRSSFVQQVQEAVDGELQQNGLELESVSLTMLDQTPFVHLDENNAFNAVGMKKLAEVIAKSKEERALIEANANVKIAEAQKVADLERLRINQETEQRRIETERAVAESEATATAEIKVAEEESEQRQLTAQITREEAVEVADQNRKIAVNEKSKEESKAKADADMARADARTAEEAVTTAGEVAAATRRKDISVISAQEKAETLATGIRVAAAAEKAAAEDRADAVLTEAQADSSAKALEADGIIAIALAEAQGKEAMIAAENALTPEIVAMKVDLARLEALPEIVEAMVKPAEFIDSITLHNVTGLGSGGGGAATSGGGMGAAGGVADAVMDMALQLPILTELGKQAGVNITDGIKGVFDIETTDPTSTDPINA